MSDDDVDDLDILSRADLAELSGPAYCSPPRAGASPRSTPGRRSANYCPRRRSEDAMTDDVDAAAEVTEFLGLYEQHGHPDLISHHMRPSKPGFLVPPAELRASHLRAILAQNARMLSLLLGHPKDPDPAPWTDPDSGATFDLMRPFTDAHGGTWEHAGWLHHLGPDAAPEPVLVLLSEDPPTEDTYARISGQWGPLTQAEPEGSS